MAAIAVAMTIESSAATTCTSSSSTTTEAMNWPLHQIAEPHECNDVLLNNSNRRSSKRSTSDGSGGSGDSDAAVEEGAIPWRSSSILRSESKGSDNTNNNSEDDGDDDGRFQGNQRFWKILIAHQDDFEAATSGMERPLVTIRILQAWRNQAPPGRFLVPVKETHPPLWKDIGDKKARVRISKALKQLSSSVGGGTGDGRSCGSGRGGDKGEDVTSKSESQSEGVTFTLNQDVDLAPSTAVTVSQKVANTMFRMESSFSAEEEKKSTEDNLPAPVQTNLSSLPDNIANAHPRMPSTTTASAPKATATAATLLQQRPKLPRFQKLDKSTRRISEQLHTAQQDGTLYGRWKERDRLVQIYKHQRQQHALLLQQAQSPSSQQYTPSLLSTQPQQEKQSITSSVPAGTAVVPVVDFILISGTMGVGKTCLAHTLKNPLLDEEDEFDDDDNNDNDCHSISTATPTTKRQQPPFLLHGKFEHCKWEDPNAVFVAIIADFCQQLLRRRDPMLVKRYRDAILAGLKDDTTLLSNLVPALAGILKMSSMVDGSMTASTTSTSEISSRKSTESDSYTCMGMQRVKQVFSLFFETIAVASPSHAIIVHWDDLNYASEPALGILTFLVTDKARCGILFLGTSRTDEYKDKHFTRAVHLLESSHTVKVSKIELGNLEETSVHSMLVDTLSLQEGETKLLKSLVFSLTKGNPTFINELLRNFQDKGILQYDAASLQWKCDIKQIPLTLGDIHSVPDLFKAKILAVPPAIQETLKIAACLMATQVDISLLKLIDTVGAVLSHLKFADTRGLLQLRDGLYYFVSDGCKEAIYDLIPEVERSSYHLKIGQRLWLHLQDNQNSEFYAILMTQMMMGDSIIEDDGDRRAVALLYLESGQKAAKSLGFQTAWYCLSSGINIISPKKKWGRDNYDISLALHNTAIEVCYCNGEFVELGKLIEEVLQNARTFEDSLSARSSQIYFLGSRNRQFEAIKVGLETLKELEEFFPCMKPSNFCLQHNWRKVKKLLRGLSDKDILQLPRMKDQKKLAAMKILNHVVLYTVYSIPKLAALIAFRMVELTLKHGISAISSMGFVLFGMINCRYEAIDDGFRYGELALQICNMFKQEVWICRTYAGFYGTIYCRKYGVKGALKQLQTAYRVGIRTGDIEFAILNGCLELWNGNDLMTLPEIDSKMRGLVDTAEAYGQTLNVIMLKPLWQYVLNLMGHASGDPKVLQGELIDDDIKEAIGGSNPHFVKWIGFCSMQAAYIFGDYDLAATNARAARNIGKNSSGAMDDVLAIFFDCMVLLAQARRGKRKYRSLAYVRRQLKKLKLWAMQAPDNFLSKQYCLQAEVAFVVGDRAKAMSHYRTAILHSREAGFTFEEALFNERLGRSYLEWKDTESAVPFLKEARRIYCVWGGVAKVHHLDEEFGDLVRDGDSYRHSTSWLGRSINALATQ